MMAGVMAAQLGGKKRGSKKKTGSSKANDEDDASEPSVSEPDSSSAPVVGGDTGSAPSVDTVPESSGQQVEESEEEKSQEPEEQETQEEAHAEEDKQQKEEKPQEEEEDRDAESDDDKEDDSEAPPANTPAALQSELEKILQKHDPSKLSQIPRMLASIRSGRVTFASLQKQLSNKYGESLTRCSTSPFKTKKSARDALTKPQLLSIQKQLKQVLFKRMAEAKASQLMKNILRQLQAGSLSFRALTRQIQKRYGAQLSLSGPGEDAKDAKDSKASKSRLSVAELKSIHAQLKRVVKEKDPSKVSLIRPLMSRLQKGKLSFEQLQVRVTSSHTSSTQTRID